MSAELKGERLETQDHIVWRETQDGVVLVDPSKARVRVLNQVASEIWKQIQAGVDSAAIKRNIAEQYDVSAEKADTDVEAFLDTLADRNLIRRIV